MNGTYPFMNMHGIGPFSYLLELKHLVSIAGHSIVPFPIFWLFGNLRQKGALFSHHTFCWWSKIITKKIIFFPTFSNDLPLIKCCGMALNHLLRCVIV